MTKLPDYAALFDASPYPYLLIAPDMILIGANAPCLRATETTAEAIIGKHIFDAFPANPSDPESTNLEEVLRSVDIAKATHKPHTSDGHLVKPVDTGRLVAILGEMGGL